MKFIQRGKVKDIYEIDESTLLFHFTDRVSAFDVLMTSTIPYKGKILADFAEYWFTTLNVKNHFIRRVDSTKIIVKKLCIIPIECVVRNYLYGSLYSRYLKGNINISDLQSYFDVPNLLLASKLPTLLFDPTTKSLEHDLPISEEDILRNNILQIHELREIKDKSFRLFNQIEQIVNRAEFIISDIKFEFGKDPITGEIILGDSIGPDEFRLWDKKKYREGTLQESFDKQILRDWLETTGFKEKADKSFQHGLKPYPPAIPSEIISKISERYIDAFEKITGNEFSKNS